MSERTTATTRKPRARRVTFSVRAEPGSAVAVSGDFNNWSPEGRKMSDKTGDGLFKATLSLAPGTYEYKFIINGAWQIDRENKDWVQNALGTLNSVLRVD